MVYLSLSLSLSLSVLVGAPLLWMKEKSEVDEGPPLKSGGPPEARLCLLLHLQLQRLLLLLLLLLR